MTNHWIDIEHADVVMIIGSNAAENHPISFKWVNNARDKRGAKLIHVDPRFTRTSAVSDMYARLRSGTDIAFMGGIINYALENNRIQWEYVKGYTNAAFLVDPGFKGPADLDGVFSGLEGKEYSKKYNTSTWQYQMDADGVPLRDTSLQDPNCVFQHMKRHYARYTMDKVCGITGADPDIYKQVCDTFTATAAPEKSATIMYAMGGTQHTYGSQNVRIYAVLQLLLGNIGVAGGGINALRGESNVQGSTDHAALFHILPGYLKTPKAPLQAYDKYLEASTPVTHDKESANWWGNYPKYAASLLKAFWRDVDLNEAYNYLGKIDENTNYSVISIFDQMAKGTIEGLFCWGQNPAVSTPNSRLARQALAKLDWMVAIDLWETETASFWQKEAGVNPADIATEVFLLPAAASMEKEGSISNSGRWAQWRYKAVNPPGDARDDMAIITDLVHNLKDLYKKQGGAFPDPIVNLSWDYAAQGMDGRAHHPDVHAVAKEINGFFLKDTIVKGNTFKAGQMVPSFAYLKADGSTCSGNWLYCNSISDKENKMMRRGLSDPSGQGFYHDWSWCWPVNRRIIYNRASVDKKGNPWAKDKPVIWWDSLARKWRGDVPDGGWAPDARHPFIMLPHGFARLFAPGMKDGPFPEHYEPLESPVKNTMSSTQVSPVVFRWDQVLKDSKCADLNKGCKLCTYGSAGAKAFPVICTTYRVTEHWQGGQMTRWLPWLDELVPKMFAEMSEEFAKEKGIKTGDKVRISAIRNVEGIEVYAYVTKRFKPFVINGETHHQIGLLWHFGYKGLVTGAIANDLTPMIGDANTMIPEYKAFLVDVNKVRG